MDLRLVSDRIGKMSKKRIMVGRPNESPKILMKAKDLYLLKFSKAIFTRCRNIILFNFHGYDKTK